MNLIEILVEQANLNFTGRVNIVDGPTGKYLGVISLLDGSIVSSQYLSETGKASVNYIIAEELESKNIIYIAEPEVIPNEEVKFKIDVVDLELIYKNFNKVYTEALRLRPPGHIRLSIDPDFILQGPNISYHEFETLAVISDYNKVEDIYRESKLLGFQTCISLVSLRKKKILKVLE